MARPQATCTPWWCRRGKAWAWAWALACWLFCWRCDMDGAGSGLRDEVFHWTAASIVWALGVVSLFCMSSGEMVLILR